MTDTIDSTTSSLQENVLRIVTHIGDYATTAAALPGADRISITRYVMENYGALEPRPALDGLRVQEVDADGVRGEWVTAPGAGSRRFVYVHGGGLNSGTAAGGRNITSVLARESGYAVLSVDYRLAPEYPFPAGLDDVARAVEWAAENGPDGPSAAESVVVIGESSGGGLVVEAALAAARSGARVPAGIVLIAGVLDITEIPERFKETDYIVTAENIRNSRADYLPAGIDAADPRVSPLRAPAAELAGLPPVLIQASTTESLLYDARLFHERLVEAGVRSVLSVYVGLPHVWHQFPGILAEAVAALDEITSFAEALSVNTKALV